MKIKATTCFAIAICIAANAFGSIKYNPSDLQQFQQTNACSGCDLSNAIFSADNVNHSNANLPGANLSGSQAVALATMNLSQSNLTNANLTNVHFDGANLSLAKLNNAVLSEADLAEANLSRADLSGASFSGANLYYANLDQTINANLAGAKLCNTVMPDGSISKCD